VIRIPTRRHRLVGRKVGTIGFSKLQYSIRNLERERDTLKYCNNNIDLLLNDSTAINL
jgi:hypothetical protein